MDMDTFVLILAGMAIVAYVLDWLERKGFPIR
jgi:hypothetical protein